MVAIAHNALCHNTRSVTACTAGVKACRVPERIYSRIRRPTDAGVSPRHVWRRNAEAQALLCLPHAVRRPDANSRSASGLTAAPAAIDASLKQLNARRR